MDANFEQPKSEHTMPVPFQLLDNETINGWNLFFNDQSLPVLILTFKKDEKGEETICEHLDA